MASNNGPYYEQGRYVVEITGQTMGVAQTGTDQFVLKFKVLGHPDPDDPNRYLTIPDKEQYERRAFLYITEKTIDRVREELQMLGVEFSSFKLLDERSPGFHDLRGQFCEMVCTHSTFKQPPIEKWELPRDNRVSSGPEEKPLDPAKLRQLDALYGKQMKGAAAAKPAPAKSKNSQQPVTVGGPAEVGDEDVPF